MPERKGSRRRAERDFFLEQLANDAIDLVRSSGEIIEPAGGTGVEAFVAAQSRALSKLSAEIADAIKGESCKA